MKPFPPHPPAFLKQIFFMAPRDVGLFLTSARTDKRIAAARASHGGRAAFEAAYADGADPWASNDPRYLYQRRKYAALIALLPEGRRFGRALDLGAGAGGLSRALAAIAGDVLGLDIAQAAVDRATRTSPQPNLRFAQGDVADLDPALDGQFDLVAVADTLYYLDDTSGVALAAAAARIARLLVPGGICLLANHYFFRADRDSRLSRRIHDAFAAQANLIGILHTWRPFYLVSLYEKQPDGS
jgi:SAM-dependent methyltransferase